MIVQLQFGVTPEKVAAACERTGLGESAVAKLKQVTQIFVDLHVDESGVITGGYVPDLKRVEPGPRPPVSFETVIAAYRKTRDEDIPALMEKVAALKETQKKREEWLGAKLNQDGVDNVKVKGVGMALWATKDTCSVADRSSFIEWIKADPETRIAFLSASASKDQVKTHIEEHGTPPPGVNYQTFKEVQVRKA